MSQIGDLPKILGQLILNLQLDASFLYGEKKQLRRLNNLKNLENIQSESEFTFEEILASCMLKGQEKVEKITSDDCLQRDFLVAANSRNQQIQNYFYLPLLKIFVEPTESLNNRDIEAFMLNYGQVLKVINKEKFVYVLMNGLVEAWMAVKTLNNTPVDEKHTLFVQLCFEDSSLHHIYFFNHQENEENSYILDITDREDWLNEIGKTFKYVSVFELEVDCYSEEFHIKERIMGIKGCNIVRMFYLVEKAYAFGSENLNKEELKELDIKLVVNRGSHPYIVLYRQGTKSENRIAIMSNLWIKFTLAQRYCNELFAQIKEEFKFYQDYQLHSLTESRVKRMDKYFEDLDITFHYDTDN